MCILVNMIYLVTISIPLYSLNPLPHGHRHVVLHVSYNLDLCNTLTFVFYYKLIYAE